MSSTIVMPEDAFNDATLKMCQARTVAEMISRMKPSQVPGDQLRDEALSLIMDLTHSAHQLLARSGKLAK